MATHGDAAPLQKKRPWHKLAIIGLAVVAVFVLGRALGLRELLDRLLAALDGLGPWAVVIFILAYIVATVLLAPASILTLGAGAYFGLFWGTVWVSIASTLPGWKSRLQETLSSQPSMRPWGKRAGESWR